MAMSGKMPATATLTVIPPPANLAPFANDASAESDTSREC